MRPTALIALCCAAFARDAVAQKKLRLDLIEPAAAERMILVRKMLRDSGYRAHSSQPGAVQPRPQPVRIPIAQLMAPGTFAADLKDGTRLVGRPAAQTALPLRLDFAVIRIPVDRIHSVQSHADGKRHTLTLGNGDRLTGAIGAAHLDFATRYGPLRFATAELKSLTAGRRGLAGPDRARSSSQPVWQPKSPQVIRTPVVRIIEEREEPVIRVDR